MRHNIGTPSARSTLNDRMSQESVVAKMHALLSGFERDIDGSGPLIESQEIGRFRRALHASCSDMRAGLNRLSDLTLRLERAAYKHEKTTVYSTNSAPSEGQLQVGLKPELWPKA